MSTLGDMQDEPHHDFCEFVEPLSLPGSRCRVAYTPHRTLIGQLAAVTAITTTPSSCVTAAFFRFCGGAQKPMNPGDLVTGLARRSGWSEQRQRQPDERLVHVKWTGTLARLWQQVTPGAVLRAVLLVYLAASLLQALTEQAKWLVARGEALLAVLLCVALGFALHNALCELLCAQTGQQTGQQAGQQTPRPAADPRRAVTEILERP